MREKHFLYQTQTKLLRIYQILTELLLNYRIKYNLIRLLQTSVFFFSLLNSCRLSQLM